MWSFFALSLVAVAISIGGLLRRYAAPSVPWVVMLATAYAWLTSFSIIVLVPIDVWSTLAKQPQAALTVFWQIAYWSTQVLTWLLLPFFQVYADAGDFTVGARCLTSLKENGLLYGLAGAGGILGLLVIVFVQKSFQPADLAALGMAMSNTFGLAAGILLMGYGLVELPREMWKSDPGHLLKWCAHRAGRLAEEVLKATAELETVVTIICANQKQMPRRDPLRPYMQIIADAAEAESPVKPSTISARQLDIEQLAADDLEYNYDKAGLAALRRRLATAIHDYKGAHSQYEEVIISALVLEDEIKCRQLREYEVPPLVAPPQGASPLRLQAARLMWQYRCVVHPTVRKVWSVLLVLMSLAVIWAEGTIMTGTHPDLSPFSLLIRAAHKGEWSTQFLTILPLAYICCCTYFALFRINAFNYNKLLPRSTTGAALMQNGSLMCRFAAPTCWNFLHMIHMTGVVDGQRTVFEENLGSMTVLPVLGKHLNMYLPLLLGVHCLLIWLKLWDRLAGACVSSKYRFSTDDADDQYTERGRSLVRREAEARANGLRIGDILHSDALDLGIPGQKRGAKKKSWFTFGRAQAKASDALGAGVEEGAGGRGGGSGGERAPLFSGSRSDDSGTARQGGGGLLAALVKNKYSSSPSASEGDGSGSAGAAAPGGAGVGAGGGGASGGGLDGIFAELGGGGGGGGPGGRGGGPRSGASMRRSYQ